MLKEVTWAELTALRGSNALVPGMKYRITDYVTTVDQEDCRSAGHQFDLVIEATTTSSVSECAQALKHAGDTYFDAAVSSYIESNVSCEAVPLECWEIRYCLDNNKDRFSWADTANGKGVIYYMKDEYANEALYDFKNVQFKRFKVTSISASVYGAYTWEKPSLEDMNLFLSDDGGYALGSWLVDVDETDYIWCYTFNGLCRQAGSIDYANPYDFSCFHLKPSDGASINERVNECF